MRRDIISIISRVALGVFVVAVLAALAVGLLAPDLLRRLTGTQAQAQAQTNTEITVPTTTTVVPPITTTTERATTTTAPTTTEMAAEVVEAPANTEASTTITTAAPTTSTAVAAPTTTDLPSTSTTRAAPTTQAPATTVVTGGGADCEGSYSYWRMVRDRCVLSEVASELRLFWAGTHSQRMSTIRDGHVLGGVFDDMLRWLVNEYGGAAANDINQIYGLYSDQEAFETRLVDVYGAMWVNPVRIGVRFSFDYTFDDHPPWIVIVPFARVDGQWKITYTGFCRYMERLSGVGLECPPDPRPDIADATGEHADSGYDAEDDPNRQAISRNNEIGW